MVAEVTSSVTSTLLTGRPSRPGISPINGARSLRVFIVCVAVGAVAVDPVVAGGFVVGGVSTGAVLVGAVSAGGVGDEGGIF